MIYSGGANLSLRDSLANIKIAIMTALPEITFMDAARKAGAHRFIYKNSDSEIAVTSLVCQGKSRNKVAADNCPRELINYGRLI